MTSSLSTKNLTHVIIFYDKSHKFITEQQYDFIFSPQATKAGFIHTPALGYFTLSSVSKIMSADEYYDQYPEKRTPYLNYSDSSEIPIYEERTPDAHREYWQKGMHRILAALQQHIDQHGAICRSITPEQLAKNKFKIFA